MDGRRVFSWLGTDAERWETAILDPSGDTGFVATGFQSGVDPLPYHLSYRLDVRRGFTHSHLTIEVQGDGWHRMLFLRRDEAGAWSWRTEETGQCPLPSPGASDDLKTELTEALDCDLGLSPLTNLMPVRRNRLHAGPGSHDIVVAWIGVPEVSLHAARQRYEHVRSHADGSVVRFTDLDSGFTADLELDHDGLIVTYPDLARRARPLR